MKSNEIQLDGNHVIKKMQELYPSQTAHAIAEVKIEMLVAQLDALESPTEADPGMMASEHPEK